MRETFKEYESRRVGECLAEFYRVHGWGYEDVKAIASDFGEFGGSLAFRIWRAACRRAVEGRGSSSLERGRGKVCPIIVQEVYRILREGGASEL